MIQKIYEILSTYYDETVAITTMLMNEQGKMIANSMKTNRLSIKVIIKVLGGRKYKL